MRPLRSRYQRVRRPLKIASILAACALGAAACGGASKAPQTPNASLNPANWSSVLAHAKGQTVNLYMYGGDNILNSFINGYVANALKSDGVSVKEVKVTDTVDAVKKVIGEKQAGRSTGGSVDMIWINGENFATGVQAKLWYCGWPKSLPNAKYVNFSSSAVANDFGLPVNGCEGVWRSANSALVYNSAKLTSADVASVSSLFTWAKAHPGQFTYSAPPDFTGSMTVRTVLYATIGGPSSLLGPFSQAKYAPDAKKLWARLNAIAPSLWRGGKTYPASQPALEQLYANGQISAFFTYAPGSVGMQVKKGLFPKSTREAVPRPPELSWR